MEERDPFALEVTELPGVTTTVAGDVAHEYTFATCPGHQIDPNQLPSDIADHMTIIRTYSTTRTVENFHVDADGDLAWDSYDGEDNEQLTDEEVESEWSLEDYQLEVFCTRCGAVGDCYTDLLERGYISVGSFTWRER